MNIIYIVLVFTLVVFAPVSTLHSSEEEAKPEEEASVAPPDLSAEKKIFDSEEDKKPKEINFATSPLNKLDEDLTKEFKNPLPLEVSFEVKLDVLRNLVEYEKNIKDLHAGILNNSTTGVQLAKELLSQDGPRFLKVDIDQENLKKIYNWDDDNVDHLNDLLKDIKSVYDSIIADLKDKPTPYEILFSKRRNDYMK